MATGAAIRGVRNTRGSLSTEGRHWRSEMGIQLHDTLARRIGRSGLRSPSQRAVSRSTVL
jgi:hypothetical protein